MNGAWRFTVMGYPCGFAAPAFLALCLVAALLGAFALSLALHRRKRMRGLIAERLATSLTPGISVWRPAVRNGLGSAALLFFGLALAQPQCGSKSELAKKRGIDVVVALDASKSMLARDVQPSRLERAKLELTTLLDELKGDRVGIVAFAGEAFIQCPLTGDYSAAKLFLRAVEPAQMPQGGTDVGAALALARQLLETADRGAKERVVVLLSDGEDLGGEALDAAQALGEAGIQVFAVGVGSETGEPIPVFDRKGAFASYQKDAQGETVMSRLDRAGLTAVAEATGGAFFHQRQGVAMGRVVERIEQLQKSEIESRLTVRYDERFQFFLAPGLLLLAASAFLSESRRKLRP